MHEPNLKRIEHRLMHVRDRSLRRLDRMYDAAGKVVDWHLLEQGSEFHPSEYVAAELEEMEKAVFLVTTERRYLFRVKEALLRLHTDPDSFGRCRRCDDEIQFGRLYAVPHARFCLACKRREEAAELSGPQQPPARWARSTRRASTRPRLT